MKKRIIFGLLAIFVVVLVGGAIVINMTNQLQKVNVARSQVDQVHHAVTELHVEILETLQHVEYSRQDKRELRLVLDAIASIYSSLYELHEKAHSETFVQEGCGACHEETAPLVGSLDELLVNLESSFSDLTMVTSLLITRGEKVSDALIVGEIDSILHQINTQIEELRGMITPMIDHIDEAVFTDLKRIARIHDWTIILTVLLVLGAVILVFQAIAHPFHLLNRGTEAIVKGDYDHRIEIKGKDEVSILAERFNYMAEVLSNREKRLHQKKLELEELNETLESKVKERTTALREKQEEINRKYLELESTNEELQASYVQLQSTAAELEEAQSKLLGNYDVLKIMNAELQRANEVKNKFLSIMSHELRTPLTVINGYLSLVLDKNYGNPSRELRDIITVVKEQGISQLGLIEDLLDLTRIESGEFRLHKQGITPDNLIDKAVENFHPKLEEKSISIEIHTEENMPEVFWDFQKMLQVFQNLLDNALKFTPSGGRIEISASYKSDFIEIRIVDNGIGIPKDRLNRVFERFFQIDSSSTRRFGGSGLGLSIVREIVMAHNGKIFVESEEGHGTTFLLLMPIGEPEKIKGPESLNGEGSETLRTAPRGNGETIMVVDDDEAFLKMMKTILPREGYRVHYTTDSTKVIQYAKKHKADLIMLDLMMPEVDGYEVCRKVRKDEEVRQIPILVVSAAGGTEVAKRVFEAGADEHITKPFDQQDILYRINYLLNRREKLSRAGKPDGHGGVEGT